MNTSEFIAECRTVLEDPAPGKTWPDSELLTHGDRILRSLVRDQVAMDDSFHNCELNVAKGSFTRVYDDIFDVQLPLWVMVVTRVFVREPGAGTFAASPYAVRDATGALIPEKLGRGVRYTTVDRQRIGFAFTAAKTLRMKGSTVAMDLMLQVAKLPCRMLKATLDVSGLSTTKLYLPKTLTLGTLELERDGYRNALLQFTGGGDSSTHVMAGSVGVGVASSVSFDTVDKRTLVQVAEALPDIPLATDTVETVLEIRDEHTRLLVLRVALACFSRRPMVSAIRAIGPELEREEQAFARHFSKRQNQEPTFVRPRRRTPVVTREHRSPQF